MLCDLALSSFTCFRASGSRQGVLEQSVQCCELGRELVPARNRPRREMWKQQAKDGVYELVGELPEARRQRMISVRAGKAHEQVLFV